MQHLMQSSAATLEKMCQDAGLEAKNTTNEKAKPLSALGAAKCYEMLNSSPDAKLEATPKAKGQKRPRDETEEDKIRPETEAASSVETCSLHSNSISQELLAELAARSL